MSRTSQAKVVMADVIAVPQSFPQLSAINVNIFYCDSWLISYFWRGINKNIIF